MPRPPLSLSLQFARFDGVAEHRAALPRHRVARWLRAALGDDVQAAELAVRVVGEAEGRQINRDFRHKDYATNVLTFEYGPDDSLEGAPLSGDIVLCAAVVAREAAAQGKDLMAHYAHLTVHGMLHLQGYDHEDADEAAAMEAVETFVMMRLGFPDPYQYHE